MNKLVTLLNEQLTKRDNNFKKKLTKRDKELKKEISKRDIQITELIKKANINTTNVMNKIKLLSYIETGRSHLTDKDILKCLHLCTSKTPLLTFQFFFFWG